jgi:hypothetical protein
MHGFASEPYRRRLARARPRRRGLCWAMADDAKPQSWWQTLPGILTSITAAITAIAGLIAVVHQLSGGSTPPNPQPTAVASPQAQVTTVPAPAPSAANGAGAGTNQAARQVPTGRFANRCGCWGTIKYGSTHPDLRCQSGLAVARKCVETCPKGYNAWHYECE